MNSKSRIVVSSLSLYVVETEAFRMKLDKIKCHTVRRTNDGSYHSNKFHNLFETRKSSCGELQEAYRPQCKWSGGTRILAKGWVPLSLMGGRGGASLPWRGWGGGGTTVLVKGYPYPGVPVPPKRIWNQMVGYPPGMTWEQRLGYLLERTWHKRLGRDLESEVGVSPRKDLGSEIGIPPPVDLTNQMKTLPSRILRKGGGNQPSGLVIYYSVSGKIHLPLSLLSVCIVLIRLRRLQLR